MSLAAGRLRHRIVIEQKVTTRDPDTGAALTSWLPWVTNADGTAKSIAAEVVPLSAREFLAAQAGQSQVTARITIRYRPGLAATMRIIHRDQTYNIAGALPANKSGLEYITIPVSTDLAGAGDGAPIHIALDGGQL